MNKTVKHDVRGGSRESRWKVPVHVRVRVGTHIPPSASVSLRARVPETLFPRLV